MSAFIPGSSAAKIVLPGIEPASNAYGYSSLILRRVQRPSKIVFRIVKTHGE